MTIKKTLFFSLLVVSGSVFCSSTLKKQTVPFFSTQSSKYGSLLGLANTADVGVQTTQQLQHLKNLDAYNPTQIKSPARAGGTIAIEFARLLAQGATPFASLLCLGGDDYKEKLVGLLGLASVATKIAQFAHVLWTSKNFNLTEEESADYFRARDKLSGEERARFIRDQKIHVGVSGAAGGLRGLIEIDGYRSTKNAEDILDKPLTLGLINGLSTFKNLYDIFALRRKQANWTQKLVERGRKIREDVGY